MNRDAYAKNSIKKHEHTDFLCPVCKRGYLISEDNNISVIDYNKHNAELSSREYYEPEWFKYSFTGKLICSNSICKEEFSFGGKATENYFFGERQTSNGIDILEEYVTELSIEYMERSPQIIPIRSEYPEELKNILESSFQLFWMDLNSCANRIRVCLEGIMDLNNIAAKDAGGNFRTLNARLKEFCCQGNQYLKKYLHSIRWIGNHASHKASLRRDDVLDIYQILEFILMKLYLPDENRMISKIADEITTNTGPRRHTS